MTEALKVEPRVSTGAPRGRSSYAKSLIPAVALGVLLGGCNTARPLTVAPTPPPAAPTTVTGVRPAPPDWLPAPQLDDVARVTAGVFGDSILLAPLELNGTGGPTWDIDVRSYESQERVAFYVNLFTQGSRNRFQERLRLGTRYEPMIRAKLRAGGIPEDMTYLAMVESGYDPNAYSSAAAVGMWQFMSSTARDVGLRVDWWVDERRDPARATDGAIRFLRDLQNQFGSLYLAAAAYNGGPGRVSRGLTRFAEEMQGSAGEDRFFALAEQDYLRSETKNYVPQIIAAALVGKESARYGFAYDTLPQYLYDSVQVAAGTALAAVAAVSGVEVAQIKELNPAVLRGAVPPNGSMWIRIPYAGELPPDGVAAALAALPEEERAAYRTVKSAGTETTASLAGKAGISSKQLAWYNPGLKLTRAGRIVAGQTVRVPTLAAVSAATNVPDPSIERYGTSTVAAARSGSVHIVKRGESLGRIAARYDISVARLKSLNGMKGNKVVAGQAIRLRASTVARSTAAKSSSTKKSPAKAPKKVAAAPGESATSASRSKSSLSARQAPAVKGASSKVAAAKGTRRSPGI